MKKRVLISSLEPSANLHLNEVLKHLDAEICGIFDEKFGTPLMPSSEFSAMGFFQVLPLIFKAKKAIKEMVSLAKTCDEILLIDSPAFNLPLAKALKKANVKAKITYYILPKVWAWKKSRAKKVDNFCDNLASILPFDAKFFKKAKYAGNPLLDEISVEKLDYSKNKTLAFLPGSRRGEISKLMPIFREVAKEFRNYRKILVVPKNFENLEIYGEISDFLIEKDTPKALAKSEFAFICSGTATLEAAIVGTPFVLCYKAKSIDIFIAKLLVGKRIKFIGLANIFYQFMGLGELHTELIQSEVTKENLIKAYKENKPEKFIEAKRNLREYLKFGSAKNVANMIEKG